MLGKLLRLLSRQWDHSHSQLVLVLVVAVRDLLDYEVCRYEGDWKTPTFSGDVDVNGPPEGMPWSQ